ncbi:MAG: hypothetical protein WCW52_05345 [Elusimicrobiales bacterium]
MRKIKKFKIPIYTYDILRKAKKRKIDLFALGLAEQESAKEYISSIAAALEPSTMFDLLTPEEELTRSFGSPNGAAGTLGVITLGAAFEEKTKAITDPELFRLAETAALVFAETGLKVVAELIGQEVAAEGFDPGEPRYLYSCPALLTADQGPADRSDDGPVCQSEPAVLEAILNRLSADKIGVRLAEGSLSPKYSLIFDIPWLAGKKKKPAPGSAAAGK